ncbi:hypothetical protein [Prevotella intermedia]|uniref:hypothetical protein n=1 Tax=Prevotella intermedia TaxID=28131 RepID=UPI0018E08F8F|nr:hypothetical protein [Prevotella intermedia]
MAKYQEMGRKTSPTVQILAMGNAFLSLLSSVTHSAAIFSLCAAQQLYGIHHISDYATENVAASVSVPKLS